MISIENVYTKLSEIGRHELVMNDNNEEAIGKVKWNVRDWD